MIAQVQEAWKRGVIAGVLLMDVAAALPSVTRGLLLRKMRNAGLDERPVRWTDSFMHDRWVVTSVDGQDGEEMSATTGLPQDSPVSPVLIALYITEIHQAVKSKIEGCRGISFADGATCIVEGYDISGVATGLKRCARASPKWERGNAVRFEMAKTEAIFFSRRRKHRRCQRVIRVGDQTVHFSPDATQWLGIWLVSAPPCREPLPQDRQSPPEIGRAHV